MKLFDQITSQLETLGREVAKAPAQIDALQACRDAGVVVPEGSKFADMDGLDLALSAAFRGPNGAPPDKIAWEKRVNLKTQIVVSGLVDQPERPQPESVHIGAVREAARLMHKHNIRPREDGMMFLPGDISAMALSPEDKIAVKVAFEKAGLLDVSNTTVRASAPVRASKEAADLIFSELELVPQKLHVNALSAFMTQRNVPTARRMQMKEILGSAGYVIFK
jgi:hypothetical protein